MSRLLAALLLLAAPLAHAGDRLLVIGPQGSEAAAVASSLRSMAKGALEVDLHVAGGPLLMVSVYHPDHKAATLAALGDADRYRHVLIVDSQQASRFPEVHFEGVYQLQRKVRERGGTPLLLPLPGELRPTAELAYRIGRGTRTTVVPVGHLQAAAPTASRADCAAAAALAAIAGGRSAIGHELVRQANGVFTTQQHTIHYAGSYAARGRVHVLPLPMPTGAVRVIKTGTSTEAGWQRSLQPMTGLEVSHLKNDDDRRSFGASDLEKAQPLFARSPDRYIICFARAFTIGAEQIRGDNQRFLQCQVYCKVEPVTQVMSLEEVARRVFHGFEVVSKYEQARQHQLSFIPLHVALARIHDQKPELQLSRDNTHMTRPFLDMLAAMSVVSRTGNAPTKIDEASAFCVGVGVRVVRQLAHLNRSGRPGIDLGKRTFAHAGALAAELQGLAEAPVSLIKRIESGRANKDAAAALREELGVLYAAVEQRVTQQRERIESLRASDPPAMERALGELAKAYDGCSIGDALSKAHKALKRSSAFRSEKQLHAAWLKARKHLDDAEAKTRRRRDKPKARLEAAREIAPALRRLCRRYKKLPLSQTVLAWLDAEGA